MAGSPHISVIIDDILEGVREKADKYEIAIADLTLDMIGDVCDLTGPRRMTRSIMKSLRLTLDETVDERNISNLYEPKLIGDVLVLPGFSFAASTNHYKEEQEPALLTHHYASSWRNKHGVELV
ncbi:hypothetical protein VC83_00379 [Pseudogymnoascus destructans]|uniref:Uncharacterized protein n=2 Tax=Pseudogymnoascus destructans TaxID=655981 RepID=L8G1S7_PSED2|nr:uncharacterized protein VC83_00379 [Pseudogymnoascus destructans]ELR06628.1 hypothetical protein GMDG_08101 [Pseudogymnoascus destructans 20631-21]OAF63203.1 hypothetical protein VC83_00379 [Pseudogymnoascus destructans]